MMHFVLLLLTDAMPGLPACFGPGWPVAPAAPRRAHVRRGGGSGDDDDITNEMKNYEHFLFTAIVIACLFLVMASS